MQRDKQSTLRNLELVTSRFVVQAMLAGATATEILETVGKSIDSAAQVTNFASPNLKVLSINQVRNRTVEQVTCEPATA
jgi:hypothetical protein